MGHEGTASRKIMCNDLPAQIPKQAHLHRRDALPLRSQLIRQLLVALVGRSALGSRLVGLLLRSVEWVHDDWVVRHGLVYQHRSPPVQCARQGLIRLPAQSILLNSNLPAP